MSLKRITVVVIPGKTSQTRQLVFPYVLLKAAFVILVVIMMLLGYFTFDYLQLRHIRDQHDLIIAENQHLKGEAQVLSSNLDKLKTSLYRVQDYANKLGEIVNFRIESVSKKTGLKDRMGHEITTTQEAGMVNDTGPKNRIQIIPEGLNFDTLIFRSTFKKLQDVEVQTQLNSMQLKELLSTLSQKKSLLSAIPTISPVQGWITSPFGVRISPFTGIRTPHRGVDIAAPVGTPVYAPADGVVIFAGKKIGFGNCIMIAHHGYGIVTRYGHNAENMVHPGQAVKRGDLIASVGTTGQTTGPHLHYEVFVNGEPVDPQKFIIDALSDIFSH